MGCSSRLTHWQNKIPKLIKDVRELFDGFQQSTSMLVAQTQMVTSLYTCIRMLKSSPPVKHLDFSLEDDVPAVQRSKSVAIEVENLQFFANDYCSLLIDTTA